MSRMTVIIFVGFVFGFLCGCQTLKESVSVKTDTAKYQPNIEITITSEQKW